jgi:hypothetical protein
MHKVWTNYSSFISKGSEYICNNSGGVKEKGKIRWNNSPQK